MRLLANAVQAMASKEYSESPELELDPDMAFLLIWPGRPPPASAGQPCWHRSPGSSLSHTESRLRFLPRSRLRFLIWPSNRSGLVDRLQLLLANPVGIDLLGLPEPIRVEVPATIAFPWRLSIVRKTTIRRTIPDSVAAPIEVPATIAFPWRLSIVRKTTIRRR